MLDFSSSLYLGLKHPSHQLETWHSLTLGKPTTLEPISDYRALVQALETLTGTKDMILGTSTVQLLFDFAIWLRKQPVDIFLDEDCYPIAKKVFTAVRHADRIETLSHYEPGDLVRVLKSRNKSGTKPVVVIDGYSHVTGKICPLQQYCEILKRHNGMLIVDDTQSLGIHGQNASGRLPYGQGGGGIVKHFESNYKNIIYVSSMAKGFGVPAAFLSTTGIDIRNYLKHSLTTNHCSPVSNAHAAAVKHALWVNDNYGEQIREKIYQLVFQFKQHLAQAGISTIGGNFPYQTISGNSSIPAPELYEHLHRKGMTAVLHEFKSSDNTAISFLITARHSFDNINALTSQIIGYMHTHYPKNRSRRNYVFT